MKEYVTDANVIFSTLISGKEIYQKIFVDNRFYLPDFALTELQYYQELILQKTKLSSEDFQKFALRLFNNVTVVPNFLVSTENFYRAFILCKDIDEKDTAYLALALQFDIELLTKDEELAKGLRNNGFQKVITLSEFFDSLNG